MDEKSQQVVLDTYKLHAELADRISQRREGANRLYVSLLVGLLLCAAAILRLDTHGIPKHLVFLCTGILGMALVFSWWIVIRSYRELNRAKYKTLLDLECRHLAYAFYTKEREFLGGERRDRSRNKRVGVFENILKCLLFCLFVALTWYSAAGLICEIARDA